MTAMLFIGSGDATVTNNTSENDGAFGFFVSTNQRHNISFFDNQAEGNHTLDCNDASTGSGTLGTANDWFNNAGYSSYPVGPPLLCTPGSRHNHN
jgi:hypothetical protein